jgi:hypothetical protein
MSRQLELDINRPSWAETDFRSEVKDLWSVRAENSYSQPGKDLEDTGLVERDAPYRSPVNKSEEI